MSAKKVLTVPLVHLNGTGKRSLVEQLCNSSDAVRKAIDALCQGAPHGRDYYLKGGDAYKQARAEHDDRLSRLQGVLDELDELTVAVDRQGA